MKRLMSILVLAGVVWGCSSSKGGTVNSSPLSPSGDGGDNSVITVLTTPNPTWTGTTTANDGPTGTVTVTFGTSGTVSWHGLTGTFAGTFNATNPGNGVHVTATVTGSGSASACVYSIVGDVSSGVFTGTYSLGNACIDRSGHGTFHLTQSAPVPCPPGYHDSNSTQSVAIVGCAPNILTITADNKSRGYGLLNPTFTATYSGFVNGDTVANLTSPTVFATTATVTSVPGGYPITPSGATILNYTIIFVPGTLTITSCGTTSYWVMNNGNDNSKQNKCQNDGGTYLGSFHVPGGPSGLTSNVCKFSPNPPGNPGNDETLITPPGLVQNTCPVG